MSYTRPPKLCGLGYVLLTWATPEHNLFYKNKVEKTFYRFKLKETLLGSGNAME